MAKRLGRAGTLTLAGTMVVAGPVMAACSSGPTYDQWAATDGAAGRINLEDVQNAFKDSKSPTDFERRANEIYEGDGLLLIRSKQDGNALILEGWEDLNKSNEIDDTSDDLLFTITKKEDNSHEMRGYGSNGYYRRPFGGGDFLFTYMMISAMSPRGYYYSTPRTHARTTMTRQRNGYRNSPRYGTQVRRNSSYLNRRGGFSASKYNQAGGRQSTARRTYKSGQRSTGAFKSSGTGVRSSWGTARSSRSSGFRGGGGGQPIIRTVL